MADNDIQLTIRGIDASTKDVLARRAASKGMSLNRYVVESLRQSVGTDASSARLRALRQFAKTHSISKADQQALAEAVEWSDEASIRKQAQDETDL